MNGFIANSKIKYTLKLATSIFLIIYLFTIFYTGTPTDAYLRHVRSVSVGGKQGRRILIDGDHCLQYSMSGSILTRKELHTSRKQSKNVSLEDVWK